MYKHIMLPTDGSDLSRKAMLHGVELAKQCGAKVFGLSVMSPYHVAAVDGMIVAGDAQQFEEESRAIAERALEQVRMAAQAAGVPCETARETSDQPWRAIIDSADANGCDLVVMASHGRRGVAALLLGSETAKVLTHSKRPVLVYR